MSSTLFHSTHASRRAMLPLALTFAALLGLLAFAASARADFTLNSGEIHFGPVVTPDTGNPPSSNSWVSLPTDNTKAKPNYFQNPTTTWTGTPKGLYTLIGGFNVSGEIETPVTGLTLGGAQPSGGIIGNDTNTFAGEPFSLFTVLGSAPDLTFSGSDSETTPRQLTAGDLSGLRVLYQGQTYHVGTTVAGGENQTVPLHGSIIGSTTDPENPATITLAWKTNLTASDPGFEPYEAEFHLVGTYTP